MSETTAKPSRNEELKSAYPSLAGTIADALAKAAEAGLERWKQKHPEAAAHLSPDDVLVDRMRGSSAIWYRIRVNLRHVPEDQRPHQEAPDPDDDPTRGA